MTMTHKNNHSDAIQDLIIGYQSFYHKYFQSPDTSIYKDLVTEGQAPKTAIIACSDARVDPALILNCSPGDLFVIRNVANLVPPCENDAKHHGTSAALEFAICFLEVEHVIVLGHTHCGGIQSLLNDAAEVGQKSFISHWMEIAKDARAKAMNEYSTSHDREKHCGEYSLMASYHNLHSFPWVKARVDAGTLSVHAWHFDLETGLISRFNAEKKAFENIVGASIA